MLNQPIGSLKDTAKVVTAPAQTSVAEAAGLMLAHGVGAVLVVDNDTLAGIFTEHDIVSRVIAPGRDPIAVHIGEVMTREPLTVAPEATLGHALALMHERGFRHLPVVRDGRPVGIVCARNALDPELEDFVVEAHRRQSYL
jgi:CBS domain-containing protein